MFFRNNEGNSIGNIRNYGYAATDANWIYYLSPNQKGDEIGIFRAKKDGSKSQQLLMGKMDILSINALDGYLYFIGIGEETFSENDDIDNKIYRLKADGSSEKEVINDNEFHNECYEIYVINQYIYYIGTDQNIYRMTLDGKSRELVSKNGAGYIGITKDYIIYNHEEKIENVEKITEINEEAATTQTNTVTYIMNLDGTNPRPLVKDKRLYSINVNKNYVYYTNTDKQIYRTKIDSNNEELVFDTTAYNLNLKGDYLYYLNYDNVESEDAKVCIYRVKADGSSKEAQKLKTLETYSAFIDIINNRIIYMDANNDYGFINLLKVDGSEEVSLYKLDYNNLENETTETEGNVEEVQESNNSEQVSGSN